jgi:hypothetical protein
MPWIRRKRKPELLAEETVTDILREYDMDGSTVEMPPTVMPIFLS